MATESGRLAVGTVTPEDRLAFTMLLSALGNAVLVLGIGFVPHERPDSALPSLDVILIQTATVDKPDKADFLAQRAQRGGGDAEQSNRPAEPFVSPIDKPDPGVAPRPTTDSIAAPRPAEAPRAAEPVLVRHDPVAPPDARQQNPQPSLPAAADERRMEMARLAAEIDRSREAYAKRPKLKFISANTREYVYAEYMAGWVAKVERIGNLNYPEESRVRQLYGSLVLTVAIRRDGSVESVEVIQSSGQQVLDEAARRIVQLATPFHPLPAGTEQEVDILHVTRTWQFLPGNVLRHD